MYIAIIGLILLCFKLPGLVFLPSVIRIIGSIMFIYGFCQYNNDLAVALIAGGIISIGVSYFTITILGVLGEISDITTIIAGIIELIAGIWIGVS